MGSITNGQLIYDPTDDCSDSVGAYMLAADGTAITHTGGAIDVNIASGDLAIDIDIRDLDSAQDNIEIQNAAGQALDIDGSGYLTANINGTVATTAAGYSSCAYAAKSIAITATPLVASALAGRKSILIQNVGNKEAYLGCDASVTTTNGIKLPKGASVELNFDDSVALHAIADGGATDFRIIEAA